MEFDQYFWQDKAVVFLKFFKQWREIKKCGWIPFHFIFLQKVSFKITCLIDSLSGKYGNTEWREQNKKPCTSTNHKCHDVRD